MINHLRQRVASILFTVETATLVTAGPAGVQARSFPCQSVGTTLYLLLPSTCDQLLNLEHDDQVLISTSGWQLRGHGHALPFSAAPEDIFLSQEGAADGCVLLEIQATRLQLQRENGWGFSETLDIAPESENLT